MLRVDKPKSSNFLFLHVVTEETPHSRPSPGPQTHRHQWRASHTVVVRSDYCPLSDEHNTSTDWQNQARSAFRNTAERRLPRNTGPRCCCSSRGTTGLFSWSSPAPWNGCQGLESPKQTRELNWINCTRKPVEACLICFAFFFFFRKKKTHLSRYKMFITLLCRFVFSSS